MLLLALAFASYAIEYDATAVRSTDCIARHVIGAAPDSRQAFPLKGTVRDSGGRPLTGAEVALRGKGVRRTTDSEGRFSFGLVNSDSVTVDVRRIGFRPSSITVRPRDALDLTVVLVADSAAVTLPELRVTARSLRPPKYSETAKYDDFFRRQKSGFGTFVSREQIEKSNAFYTLEILRAVPGVYVSVGPAGLPDQSSIRFARCGGSGKIAVYIDGRRLVPAGGTTGQLTTKGMSAAAVEMLSRISAPEIEMVEVFRGTAQIPGELNEDACAVISIWTRWNPTRHDTNEVNRTPRPPR